jgi:catechol 2,3-dioxygenase-like lactoylglutathione lyase family enzyme
MSKARKKIMARVSDIRYVAYAVPDLDAETDFYLNSWGLKEIGRENGLAYFAAAADDESYVVRLRQDATRRVDLISWAASSRADVDALFAQVQAAGSHVVAEPHELTTLGGGYGFRFFDPTGHVIEITTDFKRGKPLEVKAGEALPTKISHVVMHAPDHKALVRYYADVLGFRISDWLGDFMCFMRCNEWHHRLAFLPGPPCLNHVAYDVLSIDDMMRGIARLKRHDVDLKWGPGRHTAGNNTFSYFTTPANFAVEYTSEVVRVDEESWEATVHVPSPSVMDQWGSGVGGPQAMPHPAPDAGLFQAPAV